jgi:hypothetical protein
MPPWVKLEEPLDWTLDWLQRKGGNLLNRFGGLHYVLLYETPKVTRIRDAKLGLLYYILLGLVLVYITYQLMDSLEFLESASPVMAAHFEFRAPVLPPCTDPNTDVGCVWAYKPFAQLDYCCDKKRCIPHPTEKAACYCEGLGGDGIASALGSGGSKQAVAIAANGAGRFAGIANETGAEASEQAVATLAARLDSNKVRSYRCQLFDSLKASESWGDTVFMKTFVNNWQESRNAKCNVNSGECDAVWENKAGVTHKKFVGDIEDYTLTIFHTVGVTQYGISESSASMKGYLMVGPLVAGAEPAPRHHEVCRSRDDAVTQPWRGQPTDKAPCFIKPERIMDGDRFPLSLLLGAMNVSFDDLGIHPDESLREQGFTMNIDVTYLNSWPWHGLLGEVVYYYKLVPRINARYEQTSFWVLEQKEDKEDSRATEVARGVLLHITGSGKLCVFSVQQLLVTLTTALALITVVTFLVNLVARFLLRWSSYYNLLIYDTSGDFGRLREINDMTDGELSQHLAAKGQPTGGTRQERILLLLAAEDNENVDAFGNSSSATSASIGNEDLNELDRDVEAHGVSEATPLMKTDVEPRKGSSSGASFSGYGSRFDGSVP